MTDGKIYQGSQFIFIRPESEKTLNIQITPDNIVSGGSEPEQVFEVKVPTVFPRFKNNINVQNVQYFSGINLDNFYLSTVVTDKKIYRPGGTVNIFSFNPLKPEADAVMEIRKNNFIINKEKIKFDKSAVFHDTLEDLTEGQYNIGIIFDDQAVFCDFTVAVYSLSFMRANLISHKYDNEKLDFNISVKMGDMPYNGEMNIGLFCGFCDYVVKSLPINVKDGVAKGYFSLSGHTGPFNLVLTQSDGESATLTIPGTAADTRERIRLSSLGEIIEGGILPSDATPQRVRGIYMGAVGTSTSPVIIDSIVGEKSALTISEDLDHLMLCFFDPSTGKFTQQEHRNVKKGSCLDIEIPYPMSILALGGIGKDCFESYCVLFRPNYIDLKIEAPEKVKPGAEVEALITSSRSGKLMLVAADSRLEREDPLEKLSEVLFKNIKSNIAALHSGKVEEFSRNRSIYKSGISYSMGMPTAVMSATPPTEMMDLKMGGLELASFGMLMTDSLEEAEPCLIGLDEAPVEEAEEAGPAITTRLDFPEVIMAEIIDFDKKLTKKIKLGDQIGSFTIFAFLIDNQDYISSKTNIETSQDIYVELDVPALMSPGDEIVGKAHARCPGKGKVTVRSALTSVEENIEKFKTIEITLKSAGEVMAQIETDEIDGKWDVTSKTIGIPGREMATVSELRRLKPGEVVESERILVYPGAFHFIKDSVDALVKYPFGCAEQTSAKIYGLALVHRAMLKKIIFNGERKVRRLLNQGVERMSLFYKNGAFSLWENGEPETIITRQVLKNLAPLNELDILNAKEMLDCSVKLLLKKQIKDNALIPYAKKFAGEMKSVRDAALFYRHGIEKEKAVKFLLERVKVEGKTARWKDVVCWGGETEATCYALGVMEKESPDLFDKGLKFISGKIQNGRLYSTSDTCALLELFSGIKYVSSPLAEIDGREVKVDNPIIGKKVKAIDELFVRIDSEKEIDYLSPRSDFRGEVKIERTSLSLGEKVKLRVIPQEKTIAPLVRIYLPGNIAALKFGAGLQKMYLPVKKELIELEVFGIRKGKGKLRIVLHDMYDSEKIGILPGLLITVK